MARRHEDDIAEDGKQDKRERERSHRHEDGNSRRRTREDYETKDGRERRRDHQHENGRMERDSESAGHGDRERHSWDSRYEFARASHKRSQRSRDYDDRHETQRNDESDVKRRKDREVSKGRHSPTENEKEGRDGKKADGSKPEQPTLQESNTKIDGLSLGRSGVYIPPFKLARMMKEVQDKSSFEYQRLTWDALRKSINGLLNKVNATNIKNVIPELFAVNLIRGRGLFCHSCMKSQMASPEFTDVFAALVAVVNSKFPEVGELLLRRTVLQLKRAYKRNDKLQLLCAVKFIAHLVNHQVAHEVIALELLTALLENHTDDSVEAAIGFMIECGSIRQDLSPKGLHGEIDKRVQFLIALVKAEFQGYPAVPPELDLVEQEDQLTHEISLQEDIDPEITLDIFKPDSQFVENEKRYEELKKTIWFSHTFERTLIKKDKTFVTDRAKTVKENFDELMADSVGPEGTGSGDGEQGADGTTEPSQAEQTDMWLEASCAVKQRKIYGLGSSAQDCTKSVGTSTSSTARSRFNRHDLASFEEVSQLKAELAKRDDQIRSLKQDVQGMEKNMQVVMQRLNMLMQTRMGRSFHVQVDDQLPPAPVVDDPPPALGANVADLDGDQHDDLPG